MTATEPSTCYVCGMHATGVGVGRGKDPRWICEGCIPIAEAVKKVRRFDPYEMKAREGGMEAGAALVEEFGPDLSEWTEDQVLIFCGRIWEGCVIRLRELIENDEAPF